MDFTIKVRNRTTEPIGDVTVSLTHDAALTLREATTGYVRDGHRLRWSLKQLAPAEEIQLQTEFDCRQAAEQACLTAEAHSPAHSAEPIDCCLTVMAVPGLLDLRVSDLHDPIHASRDLAEFEITAQNLSLQPLDKVRFELHTSEHLQYESHDARIGDKTIALTKSARDGSVILSHPDRLPPDATLRLLVRAAALKPGEAEFRVVATSAADDSPVETSEIITINR